MCRAIPPIVTNVGGLPELVADGESGYVIPPEDALALARRILDLHDDPEARKRLGENARARVSAHFHIDATVSQTIQIFSELMREPA